MEEGTVKKAKFLVAWAVSAVSAVTLAAVVTLACTDKNAGDLDAINYDDVPALAGKHYRAMLGECLEHHITYADRLGGKGTSANSRFAIARCANLSASWHDKSYFSGDPWDDPTAAELEACRKAAAAYLRENHPGAKPDTYYKAAGFYVFSVCIPTKSTAGVR